MMVRAFMMFISCAAIVSPQPPIALQLKEATIGNDASFRRRRPLVESIGETVAEFVQQEAAGNRDFLKHPELFLKPRSTTEVALFCAAGCVLAIAWVFLWYACFGGLQRGLSVSNLVEAFLCLPCMWADTFTALKLRGFVRAWSYVLFLIAIPIAWNATFSIMDPIYSPVQLWYQVERCVLQAPMNASAGADPHREAVDRCIEQLRGQPLFEKSFIVHTSFIGAFFLLYVFFSLDHCGTREELRATSEEPTCASGCGDCVAVFCTPSMAVLQEKQHAADLGLLEAVEKGKPALDRPVLT